MHGCWSGNIDLLWVLIVSHNISSFLISISLQIKEKPICKKIMQVREFFRTAISELNKNMFNWISGKKSDREAETYCWVEG